MQNHHLLLEQQLAVQGLLWGEEGPDSGDPLELVGTPWSPWGQPVSHVGSGLLGFRQILGFSAIAVGFLGHIKMGYITPLYLIIIMIF